MRSLLRLRRFFQCSRKQFLSRWAKLRHELQCTREYQALRDRVCERAGGTCEECQEAKGEQIHHLTAVALKPELALDDTNCIWICVPCHEKLDPSLTEGT